MSTNPAPETLTAATGSQKIVWNDEALRASYANIANVIGGREEISVLLGQTRNWKPEQEEIIVDLNHKITLTPQTAKRLAFLLGGALRSYEQAYGTIEIGLKEP